MVRAGEGEGNKTKLGYAERPLKLGGLDDISLKLVDEDLTVDLVERIRHFQVL